MHLLCFENLTRLVKSSLLLLLLLLFVVNDWRGFKNVRWEYLLVDKYVGRVDVKFKFVTNLS
jgi:hypothetical protein